MPRHTSLKTVIDKNRIVGGSAFVMLMEVFVSDQATGEIVETLRYARNDEDIVYQGQTYSAASFAFKTVQASGEMPESSISLNDLTGVINKYIDESNGGDGWKIKLMTVATADIAQPPQGEEMMYVKGASISGYTVTLSLGANNPLMSRFPKRMQRRNRCSWIFKSAECGYSGSKTSCDYSLQGDNGCAEKGNTLRFGGFPGLRKR